MSETHQKPATAVGLDLCLLQHRQTRGTFLFPKIELKKSVKIFAFAHKIRCKMANAHFASRLRNASNYWVLNIKQERYLLKNNLSHLIQIILLSKPWSNWSCLFTDSK